MGRSAVFGPLSLCLVLALTPVLRVHVSSTSTPSRPNRAPENADSEGLCSQLFHEEGFSCAEHQVTTTDGYVLGLQRICLSVPSTAASGSSDQTEAATATAIREPLAGEHANKELKEAVRRQLGASDVSELQLVKNSAGSERTTSGRQQHQQQQRQQRRRQQQQQQQGAMGVPVLLQHGVLQGAETWLLNAQTAGISLPAFLASHGFDVWLGNTRCGRWAHGHKNLRPSSKLYWDWSWDELASHDLPSMVRYILQLTGFPSLHFIGHSQGTLILLSSLIASHLPPSSVSAAYLLAPVAFLSHLASPFAREAAALDFDKLVEMTGMHQFSLRNRFGQLVFEEVCASKQINCSSLLADISGPVCCVDPHWLARQIKWMALSSSVKNMAHFAQMVRCGTFAMFDYGPLHNLLRYGSLHPPNYDPSLIPPSVPLAFAIGGMDALSTPQDIATLMSMLPVPPEQKVFPRYSHLDFVYGANTEKELFPSILKFLCSQLSHSRQ